MTRLDGTAAWTSLEAFTPERVIAATPAVRPHIAVLGRVRDDPSPVRSAPPPAARRPPAHALLLTHADAPRPGVRPSPQALLVVRHKPLDPADPAVVQTLCSAATALRPALHNDVYGQFAAMLPPALAGADVVLIHPASAADIAKYTQQARHVVVETPALYAAVTAPAVRALPPSRLQWVWNILDGTAEADRVLYRTDAATPPDEAFVIVPELSGDVADLRTLHCIALVQRRDVACLRDLRRAHLPLLRRLWREGRAAVARACGCAASRLRAYVHYHPSFFHLHVHYGLTDEAVSAVADRAHLLPEIIDNLERYGDDYYASKTLTITVGEAEPLWPAFAAAAAAAAAET